MASILGEHDGSDGSSSRFLWKPVLVVTQWDYIAAETCEEKIFPVEAYVFSSLGIHLIFKNRFPKIS